MDDDLLSQLLNLRMAMLASASGDTAYDPEVYEMRKGKCMLVGHCGCVSYVVQQKFGGDIVGGRVGNESHLWNRLPNGIEIDLSSDQYGGDGFNPVIKGRKVKPRRTVNPKFRTFASRVEYNMP